MLNENSFDKTLRTRMQLAADQLGPDPALKEKIFDRASAERKEGYHMTRFTKAAAIAAACIAFGGVSVYAAGNITGVCSSSQGGYDYRSYNDMAKAEEKAGLSGNFPKELGAYQFEGINIVSKADTDDDGNESNKRKTLEITYKDRDGKELYLSADPTGDISDDSYQVKKEVNGTTCYYSKTEELYVPDGYKPTAEEKTREKTDPFFSIDYGSDKRETAHVSSVTFQNGGVSYDLYGTDTGLSSDQILSLASDVIDQI